MTEITIVEPIIDTTGIDNKISYVLFTVSIIIILYGINFVYSMSSPEQVYAAHFMLKSIRLYVNQHMYVI